MVSFTSSSLSSYITKSNTEISFDYTLMTEFESYSDSESYFTYETLLKFLIDINDKYIPFARNSIGRWEVVDVSVTTRSRIPYRFRYNHL